MKRENLKTMRTKWRIALAVCAVVAVGVAALRGGVALAEAKIKSSAGAHVARMVERARKELNLSDAQTARIKTIVQDAVPRGITIHDDKNLAAEEKRSRLASLHAETKTKINAVLNSDQREKLAQMCARFQSGEGPRQIMERIADELKLSQSQRAQLQPIMQDARAQVLALRDDMSLTVAQKFVRLQAIRRETRAKADEILTPAQRTRLDEMIKEMRAAGGRRFRAWREGHTQS